MLTLNHRWEEINGSVICFFSRCRQVQVVVGSPHIDMCSNVIRLYTKQDSSTQVKYISWLQLTNTLNSNVISPFPTLTADLPLCAMSLYECVSLHVVLHLHLAPVCVWICECFTPIWTCMLESTQGALSWWQNWDVALLDVYCHYHHHCCHHYNYYHYHFCHHYVQHHHHHHIIIIIIVIVNNSSSSGDSSSSSCIISTTTTTTTTTIIIIIIIIISSSSLLSSSSLSSFFSRLSRIQNTSCFPSVLLRA